MANPCSLHRASSLSSCTHKKGVRGTKKARRTQLPLTPYQVPPCRGRREKNSQGRLISPPTKSKLVNSTRGEAGEEQASLTQALSSPPARGTPDDLSPTRARPREGGPPAAPQAAGPAPEPELPGWGTAVAFPLLGSPLLHTTHAGFFPPVPTTRPSPEAEPAPALRPERLQPRPRAAGGGGGEGKAPGGAARYQHRYQYIPSAGSGREAVLPGKHAGLLR